MEKLHNNIICSERERERGGGRGGGEENGEKQIMIAKLKKKSNYKF